MQSVESAITNLEAEIIVIDNNSQDDSCEMLKQQFPKVKLIENKENLGFSKGNNIGVEQAKGEYVCILNPDTVVAEDTFETLLTFAEKQNNLGIVGCKLIDGVGVFLPESKRNVPTPKVAIKKILGDSKSYYQNQIKEDEVGKASVFVGAFMLLKRDVYNKVNGFDEDYFMYGEDIDLSYKIKQAGFENHYFGNTTVIHYKGESTLKDKTYAKRFYGAMQIFYKKHFKSNLLFDILVWLGIQSARMLGKKPKAVKAIANQNVVFSYELHSGFNHLFPFEVKLINDFKQVNENTQVIFDANSLDFKEIIAHMSASEKNKGLTFKILPKNSNFIIGSDSSKNRGEVITF